MERSDHEDRRRAPTVGRRRFLELMGLGAGTLAVAGAGGLTWRAVAAGVYAAGTGPAYAAWDQWNPPGRAAWNLVRAGVLAASAHNTQPWLFRVGRDRIDLYADLARGPGAMDPLRREMHLSLGCALENVVLAGPWPGGASRRHWSGCWRCRWDGPPSVPGRARISRRAGRSARRRRCAAS
jgi:hypothetical protein